MTVVPASRLTFSRKFLERRQGWCIAALLLTSLTTLLLTVQAAVAQEMPTTLPPTPAIGAEVEHKAWSDPLESLGTLKANESVTISATVTEIINEINFEGGEHVERGDVLIKLDDTEEQADLRSAQALRLERQNAVNRFTQLESRNMAPRADVEDSRAQLQQVDADIQALQAHLDNYSIRAPFDGVVGVRQVSAGTLVTPGTELATLDDISSMKLDFQVPEVRLGSLSQGLSLTATTAAYPDQVFHGEVATIDSRIDPVSRSIQVRAVLDNSDGLLKPGMLMRVTIARSPRETLVIPEAAVVPQGQRKRVWVITDQEAGSIEQRDIEIGSRREGEVEVTAGLAEGEMVVTHGADRLHSAATIQLLGIQDEDTDVSDILQSQRSGEDD
ncbi:MexH family multidrug efflux RND transporter periplasmic adaptor subunit [Halomonas cupida]|uniref:Membrane fusion protein, multidrug efflux system n=1 Tax=Halomonas cupida TaxID=44933 RepID=A0A1M6ZN96_9GAMM|nr:efflux RND transporter periplasmic adaptor subunit [Halomonas cupida]GEN22705.1 MexH family multidrug efflux RND transporter periplasmic adaptor subunit [Halomonas cupida]SHL31971.1 membrane fusion protein, multidrug efflux system [Halomonas cupida]